MSRDEPRVGPQVPQTGYADEEKGRAEVSHIEHERQLSVDEKGREVPLHDIDEVAAAGEVATDAYGECAVVRVLADDDRTTHRRV